MEKFYRVFAKVVLRLILIELKDRCFVYDFTEAKIDWIYDKFLGKRKKLPVLICFVKILWNSQILQAVIHFCYTMTEKEVWYNCIKNRINPCHWLDEKFVIDKSNVVLIYYSTSQLISDEKAVYVATCV